MHRSVLLFVGVTLLVLGLSVQSIVSLVLLPAMGIGALICAATGLWRPRFSIAREITVVLSIAVAAVVSVATVAYMLPD